MTYLQFTWGPESEIYEQFIETTEDIKECTQDLKLLNKKAFRALMKWRAHMRTKTMKKPEAEKPAPVPLTAEETEQQLEDELDSRLARLERKKKQQRKKLR